MAFNKILFFLAGICVTLAAFKEECPPYESFGCQCYNIGSGLNVNCLQVRSVKDLQDWMNALRGYSMNYLTLELMNVSSLPKNLFQGLQVKNLELNFTGSAFSLEHSDLSGLENSLRNLYIDSSFKRTTNPLLSLKLDRFHSLEAVLFRNIHVPEIENDWFKGLKKFDALVAVSNGMEKFGDKAFASLPNLRVLWIEDNNITEISRSMLPSPANHLNHLFIRKNKIRDLPRDMFSDMPVLETIRLDNNLIHSLPEDTWSPALSKSNKMLSVDLSGNPLQCDEDLKWVCKKRNLRIYGTCSSPVDKKGFRIQKFCRKV